MTKRKKRKRRNGQRWSRVEILMLLTLIANIIFHILDLWFKS